MQTSIVRCAIYTRKSTDEGLDKEFNTLEAQREAGENFVKSQKHQGWEVIEEQYNDGGFSGGNLNRPGLNRLLDDVRAGKVDMIVVYKIDRLTRSLLDFSKLIEVLDKHQCSFVAVTQNFNTYDSMGRLTLNVLLSFAQFEREVTAERIRDKVASSKRKGMWMGGTVPMGYDAVHKKLVINPKEAAIVREMFEYYVKCRSEFQVRDYLNLRGYKTKARILRDGSEVYKGVFTHARVSAILKNPIYIGKVPHKDNIYDGQHEAIISEELFNEVQRIKHLNRPNRFATSKKMKHALLKGLLYCECCNMAMVCTRSNKPNKIYEYYTSVKAVKEGYAKCKIGCIPSGDMDEFVFNQIKFIFNSPKIIMELAEQVAKRSANFGEREVFDSLKEIDAFFKFLSPQTLKSLIEFLVERIWVNVSTIKIVFTNAAMALMSNDMKANLCDNMLVIRVRLGRQRGRIKIVIPSENDENEILENPFMIILSKAFKWQKIINETGILIQDLAIKEKVSRGYMGKVLKMTCLAPDIVQKLIKGAGPENLKPEQLLEEELPLLWSEQRVKFGF